MKDALEVRIAHAHVVHVVERIADVVDARAPDADSLRHQARAPVQVELAHEGRMPGIGDESERAHGFGLDPDGDEAGLIDAPRHLPIPEPGERPPQPRRVDAVGHAPARAAAAKPHHQAGLALRAAVARREDAQRAVITVRASERLVLVVEARRPHERAVAEHPEIARRQTRRELAEVH